MPNTWRKPEQTETVPAILLGNTRYMVGIIEHGRAKCPNCSHRMPAKKQGFRSCYHCGYYYYASPLPVEAAV